MELGCGQGLLVELIARHASHVVGVDFDSRKCEMARDRLGNLANVDIVESDIESHLETVETATADSIVLSDTLSSLPNDAQERVLIEAVRCLRPGGLLLLKIVDTTPRWKARSASLLSFVIYRLVRASVTQDDRIHRNPHGYYDAILRANHMRTEILALHVTARSIIPHVAVLGWKESVAHPAVDGS
jgi:SAM-dependent methyltransferase